VIALNDLRFPDDVARRGIKANHAIAHATVKPALRDEWPGALIGPHPGHRAVAEIRL
jgi:hypothetical protein